MYIDTKMYVYIHEVHVFDSDMSEFEHVAQDELCEDQGDGWYSGCKGEGGLKEPSGSDRILLGTILPE